jgi:DNA-binding beta-propeller fold protein YncE
MPYRRTMIAIAAFAALTFPSPQQSSAAEVAKAGYHVIQRVTLGGEGRWDYLTVDPDSHRLYISRSTHVMVVDTGTLKPVGEVPGTEGIHGIALVPELSLGFTSNGTTQTSTVFDTKSLKTLATVKVTGEKPDAILYDPFAKRVWTFNGKSGNATAIDAADQKVAGTVALGGAPEFATSDLAGHIYVNLEDKSEVVAINAKTLAVEHRWPLAPCEEPSGLALDRAHRRLFSGCRNKLMAVMDADSGKVVATVPIGSGVDANEFDPETGLAFSSNGDGTLTVVHEDSPDKFSVVESVATERGARTMTLDPRTHRIYLVTAHFGPAPAPTAAEPHPRPAIEPGSFTILVVGR